MTGSTMNPSDLLRELDLDNILEWANHQMYGDWFTARLFELWRHADMNNKMRLARGFPVECDLFWIWANGSVRARHPQLDD